MTSTVLEAPAGYVNTLDGPVPATESTPATAPVRRVPWQGIATYIAAADDNFSSSEVLAKGKLDWAVRLDPTWRTRKDGTSVQADGLAVVRDDETEYQLGTVKSRYNVFQNSQVFAFGDFIVQQGKGRWVSAGLQRNGASVFMCMKLDGQIKVLGEDLYDVYLLFRTSHDGSRSLRADVIPFRFGCFNQDQIATSKSSCTWVARHVSTINEQVKQAQNALGMTEQYISAFQEVNELLAATELTIKQAQNALEASILKRPKREQVIESIMHNLAVTPTIPAEYRNTGYGLLQATTEYFDHIHPRRGSGNSLFESIMSGEGAKTRNRLVRYIQRKK